MNYLWGGMIVVGILFATFNGTLPEVTTAALDSAKEAVTLCITMMGVMSFWVGIMRIAENSGIIDGAARKMKPLLGFLFPDIPKAHKSLEYISTNFIANVFGLGWAATPAGLKAMESLEELEEERRQTGSLRDARSGTPADRKARGTASDEMCTFLVLNISSLQLVPVNIIAYRSQYGSVNPTAIVGPAIVATAINTLVAVVFCKVMCRKRRV